MLLKINILLIALHFVHGTGPPNLCLPLSQVANHQVQPPEMAQGPRGKAGPTGQPGAKGDRGGIGPPGQCNCGDNPTIQSLVDQLRTLNETLQQLVNEPKPPRNNDGEQICKAGLKDGRIKDNQISAKSFHSNMWLPQYARLDRPLPTSSGGTWLPASSYMGAWLQVDFRVPTRVVGVITQGHSCGINWWVTGFKISYGNSPNQLQVIQASTGGDKTFTADPADGGTHVTNRFPAPVTGRYFRLILVSYNNNSPTLRMEYLLC